MTAAPTLRDDREARRLAQTELSRPLMLEAGAGTGKTTTLVARILAWCLGPGWENHRERAVQRHREKGKTGPPPADEVAASVLEKVVAITFTEDAAAEMAQRVARELAALAAGQGAPDWLCLPDLPDLEGAEAAAELARRAGALLATLDRLMVRTIHAFCRGLLADHPLEARLHPDLVVDADGLLLEEVARETVEARMRTFYGAGAAADDPYLQLATRGIGPQELVEALVVLSQAGVAEDGLDEDPLSPARVEGLRRRLLDGCGEVDGLVGSRGGAFTARMNATALLDALAAAGSRFADGELPDLLEALAETFPKPLVDQLGKWSKADGKLSQRETEAFDGIREPLAACAARLRALLENLVALDPELLRLAHAALAPLHRQVRGELRARGIATFEDLLAEAARLLSGRPDVAAGARAGIEQLLVDEFQDTDALQCEIVRRLGLEGPPALRPALFVVGDPKQSIYGWRSADLASYDAFRRDLLEAGGRCLPLVRNFRSVPPILDEVERAVAPVMVEEPGLQPPFQRLLADDRLEGDPGFTSGGEAGEVRRGAVEHWISWAPGEADGGGDPERCREDTPKAVSYALEADALARDLRDLHDRHGTAWNEAAILLRSTSDLDVYLEALRRHGVPFAVGRDKQYYRRREVIDAAALVRCVLDPGDHLALLTVLRSPWVGVPDAALVPLWNRDFPDLLTRLGGEDGADVQRLRELRDLADDAAREIAALGPGAVPGLDRVAGWELSLAAALEALAAARRAFRDRPADEFVATLRHLFLPEAIAAARYLGAYRLANLERFFRRLVDALEDGGGDVTAVLRALRRSVTEARDAPEGKPQEGAQEAVQVLTMHQAKGLDFGHVYLPQLHKEPGGSTPATVVERAPADPGSDGDPGSGFEMKLFGAPTLGFDRVEARRRRVEAAERVRLLYVATTRPKRRLVLMGCWPADPAGGRGPREPERAQHFLDLLAHRSPLPEPSIQEHWEGLAAEEGRPPAGGTFLDGAGVLWRFPALTPWPASEAAEGEAAAEAPDPDRVRSSVRELDRRRREARARMERPFHAAASEEAHHLLRQALGGPEGDGAGPGGNLAGATFETGEAPEEAMDRAVSMAVGTAVHRLLEALEPGSDPAAELDRLRERLPALLRAELPERERPAARTEVESILEHLAGGRLLARLGELAPHVLGREVPLLLAPPEVAVAEVEAAAEAPGTGPPPPVAFLSGAIDLLYRDPGDGALVVADYKTDRVDGEAGLEARAALYGPQGTVYAEGARRALEWEGAVRFEVWFLRADRVVQVELEAVRGAGQGGGESGRSGGGTGAGQISLFDLGG